jgi:hypothetical protein
VPRRHFLPIALALFACCIAGAQTVVAQTQDPKKQIYPDPAQTPPQKLIYPAPAPTPPQKLIYPNPAQAAPVAPPPAKPQPDPLLMRPMQFYQAHGAANACGPGCSEWIAAEGKIDTDSAGRLRHLLGQLGNARPPMFLYSQYTIQRNLSEPCVAYYWGCPLSGDTKSNPATDVFKSGH